MIDSQAQPARLGPHRFRAIALLAGLLLFGLADVGIGLFIPGPRVSGIVDQALLLVGILGIGAILGLGLMLGCVLLERVLERRDSRVPWVFVLLLLTSMIGFVLANLDTFSGPRAQSLGAAVRWGATLGGALAVAAALMSLRWALGKAAQSRAWTIMVVSVGAGIGLGAGVAHVKLYAGLYSMLHLQLVVASVVAWICVASALLQGSGASRKWIIVSAVLIACASLGARALPAWRSLAVACDQRGPCSAELSFLIQPLLSLPTPEPSAGTPGIEPKFATARGTGDPAVLQAELDRSLPNRRAMNVLIASFDTVRADRTGLLGHRRNGKSTTPRLDELARDAWVFTHAYASYPTSNYSYAALFSGLHPSGTPTFAHRNKTGATFADDTVLAAFLAKRGWATVGVSAFDRVTAANPDWFGLLAVGFETYNPDQKDTAITAEEVTDSAVKALRALPKKPFFLWTQYIDPHAPYQTWPGFEFGKSIAEAYDSEIAWTDHQFGRLIDALRASGQLDNTIVVVLSDHGEEFNEHGSMYHNSALYEQQLHVPLLVRVPGLTGRRVERTVSLVDIAPTLLAILGQRDTVTRHGGSLLDTMLNPKDDAPGFAFSEFFGMRIGQRERDLRSVIVGRKKLIRHVQRNAHEMYDLAVDPLERDNIIGRDAVTEAELQSVLAGVQREISGQAASSEAPDPSMSLRRKLERVVADAESGVAPVADKSAADLRTLLFDYTGRLTPEAELLPAGALDELAMDVVRRYEAAQDPKAKNRLARIAIELGRPCSASFFEARLTGKDDNAWRAAVALAWIGNPKGRVLLEKILGHDRGDRRPIAAALARIGSSAGLNWFEPTIMTEDWHKVVEMLRGVSYLGILNMDYWIREYATEGLWEPVAIPGVLAAALVPAAGQQGVRWLIKRGAVDPDPVIRTPALAALPVAGIDAAELERDREALTLELDGDLAILNGLFQLAFERYDQALARCTWLNPGLRLRYARHLHEQGQQDRARVLLEEVASKSESEHDRALAARRIQLLEWQALITYAATFAAEISEFKIARSVLPVEPLLVSFRLRNAGRIAWQGGYWRCANTLSVVWVDAKGERLEQQAQSRAFLPTNGVLPGETIEVSMFACPPKAAIDGAHPEVIFAEPWLKLPQGGRIYHHAEAVRIGQPPKESGK